VRGPLPGAERDDAADRIVGRDSHGHTIARDHLDAKPPHPAAQLRQHLVSGVALHTVEATRVDRDHRTLHVNQIVLAQMPRPFARISNEYATLAGGGQVLNCQRLRTAVSTC